MGQTYPTSKNNALASVNKWIVDNVLDTNESIFLGNYENAEKFPCFTVIDKGAPEIAPTAFDDYLGHDMGYQPNYGRISQTVVEVNVMDKLTNVTGHANPGAVKNVMLMRERLYRTLYYAGQMDTNGNQIAPFIHLYNFDVNPIVDTGGYVYWPSEEPNTWFESSYFASSDDPQLKRVQINVRFRWTSIL